MFLMMKPICGVVYVQRTAVRQVSLPIQLCKNNEFCINSKTVVVNYLLMPYIDGARVGWVCGRTCFKMSYYRVLVTRSGKGLYGAFSIA